MNHSNQSGPECLPIEVHITAQARDKIRSTSGCPVSHRLRESDHDLCRVETFIRTTPTDRLYAVIAYSRRSTGMRYYHDGGFDALVYVRLWDDGVIPKDFDLRLDESSLIRKPYRTFLGVEDEVIASEPPRGPRLRKLVE